MAFLVAVVVFLGVLCVLNLVFTFGVVRRLREHTQILDRLGDGGHAKVMLASGETVGAFSASTVDGTVVSRDGLTGPLLVGFFSASCAPCKAALPRFVDNAKQHPGGREHVLAVVVTQDDEIAAPYVAELSEVAMVVREADNGPTAQAFGVVGFPAFAMVGPDGVVTVSDTALLELSPA